jgi:hypothetical protein
MTYEQKFAALGALWFAPALHMQKPGDWYVLWTGVERREGGCLSSGCVSEATPELAVEAKWEWATDPRYYLVINAMRDNRRAVKWNGFMWEDVDEHK